MWERFSARDRRALQVAAAAVVVFLVVQFGVLPVLDSSAASSVGSKGVEEKELALQRARRLAGRVEFEQVNLAAARERLKGAEAGLLESPSEALANAEWQRLVRELADSKSIRLGSSEFMRLAELSPDYAVVSGRVRITCRLDQLVDFLVSLGTSPKLLSATRLRIAAMPGDPEKRLNAELTIAAVMRVIKAAQQPAAAAR